VRYDSLKESYSFYASPIGVTGGLSVVERENWTFEHNSLSDEVLSWVVTSTLQNSTMLVNQLTGTIIVNNNQTYADVLVEIRNTDPNLVIQGINFSGDRWVTSNFSQNNFNLPSGGIVRVLFNVTPFVSRTNDTNKTHNIVLTVKSQNAGSTTKVIPVFINYQNMDLVNINGTNYVINVLGINATIEACKQHRRGVGVYDSGFESCRDIEVEINKTIIREVPQAYMFSEDTVAKIQLAMLQSGNVSSRIENKMNLYVDKQDGINLKVENMTVRFLNLSDYVFAREVERDEQVRRMNIRFWVVFSLIFLVFIVWWVLWLVNNVAYYNALEEARQL
jgi:hypothetical protein